MTGLVTDRGATTRRTVELDAENIAQAFLDILELRGIDCFFANPGTDFATIIDGFARRQHLGRLRPRPVAVPHEYPLAGMAYGYFLATGQPQAAMVHVGIGTANTAVMLMSAARNHIPIILFAGRTPTTECGHPAGRSGHIHWAQDSFDQAGIIREYVKWDYEIRRGDQLESVLDRALSIAMSEPMGPVYLSWPREILAEPTHGLTVSDRPLQTPVVLNPHPDQLREAADYIVRARSPLVITSGAGRHPDGMAALVELAEAAALPVVPNFPSYMDFPLDHDCHQGFSHSQALESADVVIVIENEAPWIPNCEKPALEAKIIHIGVDPLNSRIPIWGFPADLTLPGSPERVLPALTRAVLDHPNRNEAAVRDRLQTLAKHHRQVAEGWNEAARASRSSHPIDFKWVASNLRPVLGDDAVIFNDHDNQLKEYMGVRAGTYFSTPHAGSLGWGMGSALGFKMARPDRLVTAVVGDGVYMFSVPTACHWVSAAQSLPILTVINNNQRWHAVKRSVNDLHPEGWSAKLNDYPLTELPLVGRFEKICEAFGGYGERVEDPEQVIPALERARRVVLEEGRQAVLDVICQ